MWCIPLNLYEYVYRKFFFWKESPYYHLFLKIKLIKLYYLI
jgi:hypothetical protein